MWDVFRRRGMGFFAAAVDGDDLAPAEDFSLPPTGEANGRLTGVVTDQDAPLAEPRQGIQQRPDDVAVAWEPA